MSTRVFLDWLECNEIQRRRRNAVENGWYDLKHSLVGWQAVNTYFDYYGQLIEMPWETDPFPSEICPACKRRVKAGDVAPIKLYKQEENRLCRWIAMECSWCRSDHPDIDQCGWPRGTDGRWMKPEDCS